ncbi:MAG: T9SS type A sorting domain-containing protein [Bacteroidota bacterium]
MKTIIKITTLLYVFLFADTIALATTLHVPANYTTIEGALYSASANDTVLVQPGTYNENITWPLVHGIKLISAGDTTNTIISGDTLERVIRFLPNFWYDSTTEINGFTITNGNGGIHMEFASPRLRNLNITGNEFSNIWAFGGGIYCSVSSPILENVSITNNVVKDGTWHEGGGMFCRGYSKPTLTNVVIANNTLDSGATFYFGAGLYFTQNAFPTLTNVLIANNTMDSGGVYYGSGGIGLSDSAILMNVTIVGNRRLDGLGIQGSGLSGGPNCIVTNTISWNINPGVEISGVPNISYSDIRGGWTGNGNVDNDPMFVAIDDFHLQSNSPCIDTGTLIGAPALDIEDKPRPIGANIDLGVYEMGQPADFTADNIVVCEGNIVTFTDLSAGIPTSWEWTFEGGIPAISSNQNPSVIYDTAGVYDVELQISYGSDLFTKTKTNYIIVDTTLAQANTPFGQTMVCNDNVVEYTADSVPYASSYQWEVLPVEAGIITGDSLVGVFYPDPTWTGSYTVKVRGLNSNCSGSWSDELQAQLILIPTPFFITGEGPYCGWEPGSEPILEDSELGVDYELYLDNVATGIIVPGTDTAISFGYVTEEGIYSAIGYSSASCISNMWGDIWVYMIELPEQPGIPIGPQLVCNNEDNQYISSGSANADTLLWGLLPIEAGEIVSNGNDISISWNNAFSGTVHLSCVGINECGPGLVADVLEITVVASPNPQISGLTLVCKNNDADYETDYIAGSTYLWNVTGGEIIAGAGTNMITIGWGDPGIGYINLLETNAAGCEQQTDDFIVTIDECPGIMNQRNTSFSLTPNPTRDWILISCNENILTISVLDLVGNVVINRKTINKNEIKLNLSGLDSGIYIFRIHGENMEGIYRVVKL